jgi:hypothetical protein
MIRTLVCSLAALLLVAGAASADVIKGKVKSVSDTKITLTVDDKDKTYDVAKEVKVVQPGKKNTVTDVTGGMSAVKTGDEVTITTDKQGDKETVKEVLVPGGKKKKKNK